MSSSLVNRSNIRELPKPEFIDWLVSEDDVTLDGADLRCYRIEGTFNEDCLQRWALHVRRHYLRDDELIDFCSCFELNADEHLRASVIPDAPYIRSGDFAEIVISDLVQFIENYSVPRYKQWHRVDKNNSEHGTDVIAYRINDPNNSSTDDELLAIEVKARSSSTDLKKAISDAAHDSKKDHSRIAMTLNYYARRSLESEDSVTSKEIKRFLHMSEHPCKKTFAIGAVAGIEDANDLSSDITASELGIEEGQTVFVIHKSNLMELIHAVYDRCVS